MVRGIFLIENGGNLVKMREEQYVNEDVFQTLLAAYPDLLAGDQMNENEPRRWLLVSREFGIPDQEGGANRWSLDHLFLDQEGIPTLVEVKRSADTRIRREVVGQMLDYAANAVVYWPVEAIMSQFSKLCEKEGADPGERLAEAFGDEIDIDDFWQLVKTNLQAGRIRMVFVADKIPQELRRIVEFLNGQMDPAEVLAVEIKQYVGGEQKTLVPRLIGQTAEAQIKKTTKRQRSERWQVEDYISYLRSKNRGNNEDGVAGKIIQWGQNLGFLVRGGRGASRPSVNMAVERQGKEYSIVYLYTGGPKAVFELNIPCVHDLLDNQELFIAFLAEVNKVDGIIASEGDPGLRIYIEKLGRVENWDHVVAAFDMVRDAMVGR